MMSFIERTPIRVWVSFLELEWETLVNRTKRTAGIIDKYAQRTIGFLTRWKKQFHIRSEVFNFFKDLENEGLFFLIISPWVSARFKIREMVLRHISEFMEKYIFIIIKKDFTYHKYGKLIDLTNNEVLIRSLTPEIVEYILLLSQGPIS